MTLPQTLTTAKLAQRWKLNPGTLRNWRSDRRGPRFFTLGPRGKGKRPRVRYKLTVVIAFERAGPR